MNHRCFALVLVAASLGSAHAFAAPSDASAPTVPAPAEAAPAAGTPTENSAAETPATATPAANPAPALAPPPAPVLVHAPPPRTQVPLALGLPAQPTQSPYDDSGVPDDGTLGSHQTHFAVMLGVRSTLIKTRGFDVFADDDALTQASFAFGRVLYADGPWSFASSIGWDVGSRSSNVRGAATSLDVHRFTLIPEARYHFFRRLYAFGRVGAGGALLESSLQDAVSGGERSRHPLCFTFDASVGGAFELFGQKSGLGRTARGWLLLDAGYLFTSSTDLVYANDASSPARAAPIALGSLALSGASARLSAAITF